MTVKALLKDNPDLVFSKDNNGNPPLHWAALWGHEDVAEALLAGKAGVNAEAKDGLTPLAYAVLFGRMHVPELLRLHGGHE